MRSPADAQVPLTAADQEQPRSFQVATLSAMAEVLNRRASGGLFRISKSLDQSSADGLAVPPPPPERTSVRQGALRLVRVD